MIGPTRRVAAGAALALAVVLAGCGGAAHRGATNRSTTSSSAPTTTQSTSPPATAPATSSTAAQPASTLPGAGYYADGPMSQPRYYIDLVSSTPATVSGTVGFQYQDGRTQSQFSFSGAPRAGQATFTTDGSPSTVQATYTSGAIDLPGCNSYLPYAGTSAGACSFSFQGTSLG